MSDLDLIEAAKSGNYAEAEALIKKGADVNQADEVGWTPLNFAAGRGDLPMVKLLVESGADIFKQGRDLRTPYMIALAAGRVSVVKYLKEVEDQHPGPKPPRPERKYCKAYHLGDLRKFPMWSEIPAAETPSDLSAEAAKALSYDKIVYLHDDFTVTKSMWRDEDIIFNDVDPAWKEFCENTLQFKIPSDLDLIVPNEASS